MGFLSSLFGLGSSRAQPSTSTVVQAQKLPSEIAPFVEEVVGEARELYKQRLGEGYVPFTGETIAPFTPQEETAMTNIEGLVGTSRPLQEEALGVTRGLAEKFTPEKAQEYMSPYQRAVTDIEKREAERRFDREIRPRFEAEAISAGGLSGLGSRAGVESAELERGQAQLLADIEAKGLQSAFRDAQQQFAQQKQREAGMATQLGKAGPAMLASGLQEAGALQRVGEERRDLGQSALDEAYFKFLEEQRFPEQTLAEYSGFVYGNPMAQMPTQTTQSTGTPYQPSLGQTLLGVGSTLGAAALRNPNIFTAGGGYIGREGGGFIDRDKGLSGLPMFRRQAGTQVIDEDVIVDDTTEIEGITEEDFAPAPALKDPQSVTDILAAMKAGTMKFPGEEAPEVVRKRSAETSQKYTDLINKIYPESQNAFLADALQAFGSAVVSEGNFGKAFNDTFIKLQEAGIKRQDAKRIALGKVGIENLGRSEKVEEFIRNQPKRIRDALVAARKSKLQEKYLIAKTKDLDPKNKLRKDIEKLGLGLGSKEGEGFISNVSAILKAQNPDKYESKYPGAGDVIEDLTEDSTRLVAIRAATLMKEKPGTTINNATLIAFDELYRAGQLEEDTWPGTFGLIG
jgi:hypothetical protein